MCAGRQPSLCLVQRENKDGHSPLLNAGAPELPKGQTGPHSPAKEPPDVRLTHKGRNRQGPRLLLGDAVETTLAFLKPFPGD